MLPIAPKKSHSPLTQSGVGLQPPFAILDAALVDDMLSCMTWETVSSITQAYINGEGV